ncbi:ABC-2 transporter permease [Coprobacillus sp. AF13-15]|nr:ABC-2 transporter permease [Coprobacillus sp. AF13-4LB]RHS16572.1 ABC-2 transporter permease [Coprobacillus sp. AF13-25]RHS17442.1 ABC-2 transporter permease [Coprobacillus sp. AF13-15]
MKGLFYKDFCYIKESKFLLVLLVVFGFGFSYFYKNPNFVLGYFSIFPSIMLMSTLSYDSYNHGLTTLFTLPINRKDYLKQKYLLGFILGIFFLIIASTSYYQIEHSFKFINSDFIQGCFLILIFSYLVIGFAVPVGVYFEAQKSQLAMIIVFGGLFLITFILYFIIQLTGFNVETLLDFYIENQLSLVCILCTFFVAFINYLSCKISLKLINKKEY